MERKQRCDAEDRPRQAAHIIIKHQARQRAHSWGIEQLLSSGPGMHSSKHPHCCRPYKPSHLDQGTANYPGDTDLGWAGEREVAEGGNVRKDHV